MNSKSISNKKPWEPMRLVHVGAIADVVKGGGGKMSINAADSGDSPKKPRGQG